MSLKEVKEEWREEAREFAIKEGYSLFSLDVMSVLDLMVEFAIKKHSERSM